MTISNRPNYQVYLLDLSTVPATKWQDIACLGSRVSFVGAYSGGTIVSEPGGARYVTGGTKADATLYLQIGKALGDPLPLQVGSRIRCDNKFDALRVSWDAQSVIAVLLVSDDAQGNGVEADAPPTVTSGNLSIVQGGNTAAVNAAGELSTSDDIAKVNGNAVAAGNGATTAGTLRVTVASDSPSNPLPNGVQSRTIDANAVTLASTAAVSLQIVAPATNVNGVVIRDAFIAPSANGGGIYIGAAAPTSIVSNAAVIAAFAAERLAQDIFIPAGQGLYFYNGGGSSTPFSITYRVL